MILGSSHEVPSSIYFKIVQKAFPLGVNRTRTTNASDAVNVFVFAANNSIYVFKAG